MSNETNKSEIHTETPITPTDIAASSNISNENVTNTNTTSSTNANTMRSPICCVLGHVDVGKTKLLDALRESNIQEGESGGITQQIGATFFHKEYIDNITSALSKEVDIPGLLFIDTPGHDCFTNLRIRGIEIADIAIVVVDIIKGLERQTIECINLLKAHNTPFIVVLNKLDKIVGWNVDTKVKKNAKPCNLKNAFKRQNKQFKTYLDDYCNKIVVQFAENEINAAPCYNNPNDREFVSMVPLSAHRKDGIPNLLMLISKLSSTYMKKKLTYHDNTIRGYVMDIYKNTHHGTVVNIILVDGLLNRGANAIFCGNHGCIDLSINDIYEPDDNTEMKGKTKYISQTSVHAAKGIMIKVDNPHDIIPGTKFIVYSDQEGKNRVLDKINNERNKYIAEMENKNFSKNGIYINSPSYGPLEALWNMCQSENIPVGNMVVGPITKTEIMKVAHNISSNKKSVNKHEYSKKGAVILNYQGVTPKETSDLANSMGVTIIDEDIIYHIITKYKEHRETIYSTIRNKYPSASNSFELGIISKYIFRKKDPVIMGVKVKNGEIKPDMTIKINRKGQDPIILGKITSIENNNKKVKEGKVDEEVCIKIESIGDKKYSYGIDFTEKSLLTEYLDQETVSTMNAFPDVFETK